MSEDRMDELIETVRAAVKPTGWKVIVAVSKQEDKTAGGVYMPDEVRDREQTARVFGLVVGMGPLCFTGDRFEGHRFFDVGDWVMFRPYSGTRFRIKAFPNQEFRIINDDVPEAVVSEPTKIERA